MSNDNKVLENRGVYIHVPFCVKKCAYCDFLSFPANQTVYKQYVEALIREIPYRAFLLEAVLPQY